MKRHTMKSFWLLQNLGGIRRLLRRGIAKKYIAEKYGINVLTLKRFVAREAPDIPWGAGGKAKRQRVERNATIVRRVVDLGETYKRVGEDYGLTREAVRLIVVKGHPGWKRPLKYTPCKRCGKKRTLSEVRARTRRSVDEANELCGACRVELRRRVVVLTCIGCVRQTKRELSEILRRKNANTKLNKQKTRGVYLCQRCFYHRDEKAGQWRKIGWSWREGHARRLGQVPEA